MGKSITAVGGPPKPKQKPADKKRLYVPKEGTILRQAAEELMDAHDDKAGTWFVPSSGKIAKGIRTLRAAHDWPIEDREGDVASTPSTRTANHEYRLDPERIGHYEFHE